LVNEFDIQVDWRGFELHPETPRGGMELSRLYPGGISKDREEQMQQFAASFGIHDMKRAAKIPNTRRALGMAEFARDQDKLDSFRSLTMEAYWKEGQDIEDSEILRGLALASGLDPDIAIKAADDPVYLSRVDTLRLEATQNQVSGIPTFIFGAERVVGCQKYEVIAAAAKRAGAKPRQ
jgi:predicted DsbA family dithiol-disulfide isomerase